MNILASKQSKIKGFQPQSCSCIYNFGIDYVNILGCLKKL
jgi:hypothetical protein